MSVERVFDFADRQEEHRRLLMSHVGARDSFVMMMGVSLKGDLEEDLEIHLRSLIKV